MFLVDAYSPADGPSSLRTSMSWISSEGTGQRSRQREMFRHRDTFTVSVR